MMIDYKNLANSAEFYRQKGYTPIEVPWTVSEYVDDITKPIDRIHYRLEHNSKCLIASGEQGFLYLYLKDLHIRLYQIMKRIRRNTAR